MFGRQVVKNNSSNGRKIIFIGNGGSSSIASHQVTDFCKNGGMRAIAFYKKAFGAKAVICMQQNGKVGHAELTIGDSKIMLSDGILIDMMLSEAADDRHANNRPVITTPRISGPMQYARNKVSNRHA